MADIADKLVEVAAGGDVKHHTLDQLASLFDAAIGQRLTYKELIA